MKDFLPAEEREEGKDLTAADLKGTVQSPQFKQVRKNQQGIFYDTRVDIVQGEKISNICTIVKANVRKIQY